MRFISLISCLLLINCDNIMHIEDEQNIIKYPPGVYLNLTRGRTNRNIYFQNKNVNMPGLILRIKFIAPTEDYNYQKYSEAIKKQEGCFLCKITKFTQEIKSLKIEFSSDSQADNTCMCHHKKLINDVDTRKSAAKYKGISKGDPSTINKKAPNVNLVERANAHESPFGASNKSLKKLVGEIYKIFLRHRRIISKIYSDAADEKATVGRDKQMSKGKKSMQEDKHELALSSEKISTDRKTALVQEIELDNADRYHDNIQILRDMNQISLISNTILSRIRIFLTKDKTPSAIEFYKDTKNKFRNAKLNKFLDSRTLANIILEAISYRLIKFSDIQWLNIDNADPVSTKASRHLYTTVGITNPKNENLEKNKIEKTIEHAQTLAEQVITPVINAIDALKLEESKVEVDSSSTRQSAESIAISSINFNKEIYMTPRPDRKLFSKGEQVDGQSIADANDMVENIDKEKCSMEIVTTGVYNNTLPEHLIEKESESLKELLSREASEDTITSDIFGTKVLNQEGMVPLVPTTPVDSIMVPTKVVSMEIRDVVRDNMIVSNTNTCNENKSHSECLYDAITEQKAEKNNKKREKLTKYKVESINAEPIIQHKDEPSRNVVHSYRTNAAPVIRHKDEPSRNIVHSYRTNAEPVIRHKDEPSRNIVHSYKISDIEPVIQHKDEPSRNIVHSYQSTHVPPRTMNSTTSMISRSQQNNQPLNFVTANHRQITQKENAAIVPLNTNVSTNIEDAGYEISQIAPLREFIHDSVYMQFFHATYPQIVMNNKGINHKLVQTYLKQKEYMIKMLNLEKSTEYRDLLAGIDSQHGYELNNLIQIFFTAVHNQPISTSRVRYSRIRTEEYDFYRTTISGYLFDIDKSTHYVEIIAKSLIGEQNSAVRTINNAINRTIFRENTLVSTPAPNSTTIAPTENVIIKISDYILALKYAESFSVYTGDDDVARLSEFSDNHARGKNFNVGRGIYNIYGKLVDFSYIMNENTLSILEARKLFYLAMRREKVIKTENFRSAMLYFYRSSNIYLVSAFERHLIFKSSPCVITILTESSIFHLIVDNFTFVLPMDSHEYYELH